MAERIELEFRRALDRLCGDATRVLAAVSGGADSVALLRLLARRAGGGGSAVVVAHLDHALRRGSAADRRFVERLAAELGLTCVAERIDVAAVRRRDESLEEAARRVRRAFLLRAMRAARCSIVLTGHTLDDQAETVLMRLVRGAGPGALAGIAERGPGPFARPLLGLERQALREWLGRHGRVWREDPSNADLRHDRNRVRARILPLLTRELNPRAAANLVRAAERLRDDARLLDALAEAEAARVAPPRRGRVVAQADGLTALPAPLAGRVARSLLGRAGIDPRRVSARHVAALLDLAAGAPGRKVSLPGGATAERDAGGRLVLRRAGA